MNNLKEMKKILQKYNLPKLSQEEVKNMNRPITNTDMKTVTKIFQQKEIQSQMYSQENFTKSLEKSKH